jgi:tetratricopeptide (TPR) repeat protein
MGKTEDAIQLWEQAFMPYLKISSGHKKLALEKTLNYRIGILYYRIDATDKALNFLNQAAKAAETSKEFYSYCRILYSIGYIYHQLHNSTKARYYFEHGSIIARTRHDWEAFIDHLLGLRSLISGLEINFDKTLQDVCSLYDQIADRGLGTTWELITTTNFALTRPAPKLPAYNPLVDLAAVPKINLNKVLENPENTASNLFKA